MFQGHHNGVVTHVIDAYHLDTSSWVRFVNSARNSREQNAISVECKGRIYYVTHKDIYPRQEILVYYGDSYAEQMGVDIASFSSN